MIAAIDRLARIGRLRRVLAAVAAEAVPTDADAVVAAAMVPAEDLLAGIGWRWRLAAVAPEAGGALAAAARTPAA